MNSYVTFLEKDLFAEGTQEEVALKMKKHLSKNKDSSFLTFDESTGKQIDFDLHGTLSDVQKRYESKVEESQNASKVGRPKLGVVSREVSLLPRHWDWLASQPDSASVTLRRLVEDAMKRNKDVDAIRVSQDATYRFMSVMAGDLIGYEEALRALYAREEKSFNRFLSAWPKDISHQIKQYAKGAFSINKDKK